MLIPQSKDKPEKRLAQIYARLAEAERKTLLDCAELLATRSQPDEPV